MTKIDIFSGFLGAGKTTLIKKLIGEAYVGEQIVLIENEFGEIGIDGGFLAEAGIKINEMNSGCICCSLVGDFAAALEKVIAEYNPDRILIEPSGVGKLSDVIRAVQNTNTTGAALNGFTTIVDANKCKMYMKNFGEFFNDQVENAGCIVLSHTDTISEKKLNECIELLKSHNTTATIVSTPWSKLSGEQLLSAMERKDTLEAELKRLEDSMHEHHHHDEEECHCHEHDHEHHHHHDEEECHCHEHDHEHHHHHDEEECHCHEHDHEHHHHHDEDCHCHEHDHEHHHHHDEDCHCHEHDHEHHHHHDEDCHCHEHHYDENGNCSCGHHHHHHADEVFTSWGRETSKAFSEKELHCALDALMDEKKYGVILRAKGIVACDDGRWIHFDYIPGESDIRYGSAGVIGRLCVIGSKIDEHEIAELFGVEA